MTTNSGQSFNFKSQRIHAITKIRNLKEQISKKRFFLEESFSLSYFKSTALTFQEDLPFAVVYFWLLPGLFQQNLLH